MFENTCEIWRADGDEDQDYGLLRCGVVCLIDGTNVSEEPTVYIFVSENRGSIMFRNTCISIAVRHIRAPPCFSVTVDEMSHFASLLLPNYFRHKTNRN